MAAKWGTEKWSGCFHLYTIGIKNKSNGHGHQSKRNISDDDDARMMIHFHHNNFQWRCSAFGADHQPEDSNNRHPLPFRNIKITSCSNYGNHGNKMEHGMTLGHKMQALGRGGAETFNSLWKYTHRISSLIFFFIFPLSSCNILKFHVIGSGSAHGGKLFAYSGFGMEYIIDRNLQGRLCGIRTWNLYGCRAVWWKPINFLFTPRHCIHITHHNKRGSGKLFGKGCNEFELLHLFS